MKYIKLFEDYKNQYKQKIYDFLDKKIYKGKTLWRGVDNQTVALIENGKTEDIGRFFSTEKHFAEDYGENIFEVKLLTNNVFNSIDPRKIHELYDNGYTLTDDYAEDSGNMDFYSTYDFDNDEYPTAEAFLQSPHSNSDTWEVIEHSHGVLDYIMSKYDVAIIYEGGIENYYIDDPKNYEIINIHKKDKKEFMNIPNKVEGGLSPKELADSMKKYY